MGSALPADPPSGEAGRGAPVGLSSASSRNKPVHVLHAASWVLPVGTCSPTAKCPPSLQQGRSEPSTAPTGLQQRVLSPTVLRCAPQPQVRAQAAGSRPYIHTAAKCPAHRLGHGASLCCQCSREAAKSDCQNPAGRRSYKSISSTTSCPGSTRSSRL